MHRIAVSDVAQNTEPEDTLEWQPSVRGILATPIEASWIKGIGADAPRLVVCDDGNALAAAARLAFYRHFPLVLTPDALWFTLAQGFATHLSLDPEGFRHRFVTHEGRERLVVERMDILPGDPDAPWPEVFAEFSDQIGEHVGKARDLVVADFSTTGPVERAASEVLVMDTFQAYFEYICYIGCGIPYVRLEGTPEDWRSIRSRVEVFAEYGLERWVKVLLPILDKLVAAAEGEEDPGFWQSFVRRKSFSGGETITGWLLTLFPYLMLYDLDSDGLALQPNPWLSSWKKHWRRMGRKWGLRSDAPSPRAFPGSLASAPVKVITPARCINMRFVGGLFGVTQEPETLAVAPTFGWAIIHER